MWTVLINTLSCAALPLFTPGVSLISPPVTDGRLPLTRSCVLPRRTQVPWRQPPRDKRTRATRKPLSGDSHPYLSHVLGPFYLSQSGGGLSATFTWHSRSLLWNLCRNCLRGQNERKTTIKHEAVRVTSGIYIVPLIPPSPEGYFPACQSNAVVLCACGVVFMGMKERKEITPKDTKYTNMRLTLRKNMRDHPPLCWLVVDIHTVHGSHSYIILLNTYIYMYIIIFIFLSHCF